MAYSALTVCRDIRRELLAKFGRQANLAHLRMLEMQLAPAVFLLVIVFQREITIGGKSLGRPNPHTSIASI